MTESANVLRNRVFTIWVVTGLICVLIAVGAYFMFNGLQSAAVKPVGSYPQVPDFSFTERSGQPFGLANLKGKVWVADFIFTRCPGQCPIMSSHFAELQKLLPKRDDVALVSFSIDPQHDTPEVLSHYADGHDAEPGRWFFLTGDEEKLHQLITRGFLLPISRTPAERVAVEGGFTHSSRFVLVDRQGNIRGYIEGLDANSPAETLSAIKVLLRE